MAGFKDGWINECRFEGIGALGIFVDRARFFDTRFYGVNLGTVVWRETILEECLFRDCSLRKSKLEGLRLFDSEFLRCDFTGTDWDGIDVRTTKFTDCLGGPS